MFVLDTMPEVPVRNGAAPPHGDARGCLLPAARAVFDLSARSCRWPIGEIDQETFRFCNEPRARGSYCPTHARLSHATVPAPRLSVEGLV